MLVGKKYCAVAAGNEIAFALKPSGTAELRGAALTDGRGVLVGVVLMGAAVLIGATGAPLRIAEPKLRPFASATGDELAG